MDNIKQSSELSFALRKIVTKQFAVFENVFKENDSASMNLKLTFSVNKECRTIDSSAKVTFSVHQKPFILLEIACFFEIKKESWKTFLGEDGKIRIPQGLLCHLAMHTVGTLRGVLHSKTENTDFNRFVLPPIDVNNMIKDDLFL